MPESFFLKFLLAHPPCNILNQKELRFIFNISPNSAYQFSMFAIEHLYLKPNDFRHIGLFYILFLPRLSFAIFLIIGSLSAGIRCL